MEEESRLRLESLLDSEEKKILCERELRSLELRAYGALLTAFRAGGELDEEKRDTLSIVRQSLKISEARHKLEVRRVATDPLLCRIAESINGFNTVQDWRDEGFIELPSEKIINRLSTRSLSRRIKIEQEEEEEGNERRGQDEEIESWRRRPTRVQVGSTLNVSPTLKRHQKVKKTIKELTAVNLKTEEPLLSSLSISSRFKNIQNGWGNINRNPNVNNNNNNNNIEEDHSEDSDIIDNNTSKMTPLLTHLKQVAKLHEMEKKTIDSSSDTDTSQEISIESLKRKGKLKFVSHKRPLKQLKEKQVTVRRKSQQQQQHQYPHVNQPLQNHHQQQQPQPQQQQQKLIRKPKSPAKLQKLHLKKQQLLQQKRQFVGDNKNLPTNQQQQLHRASPDIIDAPISPVKSGNINNNNLTNTMNVVATNISISSQNESRIYDLPRGPKRKSSSSKMNPKSKLGTTKRFKKVHPNPQQQIDRIDDQGDDEDEEEEENVIYSKSSLPSSTVPAVASSSSNSNNKNNNRKVLHKVKIRRKPKISMNERIRHLNKEDDLPDSPSSSTSDLRNDYHHQRPPKVVDSRFDIESLHPNYHTSSSSGPMYPRPSTNTTTTSGSRRGLSKTRGARGTVGSRRGSGTSRGRGRMNKNGGSSRSSRDLKQNQRTVKPRIHQSKRKQLDEIRVELKSESESDIEHQQHHRHIEKELLERRIAMQKTLDLEHQLTMRRLANMGNKSGDVDLDMDAELDEYEKIKLARMNITSTTNRLRTPDRMDNNERSNIKSPEKYPKYINDRGSSSYDQIPSSSTTTATLAIPSVITGTTTTTIGENKIRQRNTNNNDRSPIRKPIKKYNIKSDNDDNDDEDDGDDENNDDDKSDEEDRNRGKDNYQQRSSRENSKTPTPGENGGDSSSSQSQSQSKQQQQQRESSPASSTTSEKDNMSSSNNSNTSSRSKISTPSKIPIIARAPLPAPVFSTSLDKETFNKKRQKILQNFTSGADSLTSSTTASSLARRAPIFSATASSSVVIGSVSGNTVSGTVTSTVSGLPKPPGIIPQRKAQPHILVNSKAQRNLNAAAAAANANNTNTNNPVGVGNLTSSSGGIIGVSGVNTLVSSSNSVINTTTSIINGPSISSIGINNNPPGVPSLINQGLITTATANLVGSTSSTILGSHHPQQQQQPTANLSSLSSMTNAIPVKTSQGANIIFLQKAGGNPGTTVTSQIGGLSSINNPTMSVGALGMQHSKTKAIIMRRPINLPNRQGNVMILDVPKNPNQVLSPQYLQTARILSSSGDLTLLANYQNQGGVRKIMGAQVSTTPSLSSAASSSIVSPSIVSTNTNTLSLNQGSGHFSVNQLQMNLQQQQQDFQQPTVITTSAGGGTVKVQTKRFNRVFPPKDVIKVSSSSSSKQQQQQQILSVPISTTEISKASVPNITLGNNFQIQIEPDTIQMIPEVEPPYYEEEVVTTSSTNVVSSLPNDNNTTNIIPANLTFPSPIKIPTNNSSSSSLSVGGNVLSFNITKDNIEDNINMDIVGESEIVVENSLNLFESCMSDNGNYPSSSSDPNNIITTLTNIENPNNSNLPNLIISTNNNNSGNNNNNNNVSNLSLPSSSRNINNSTNNQIIDTTGEISGYVMTNFKDSALLNQDQNSRQTTCILSTRNSGRIDSHSSLSLSNNNLQHNQQTDSSTINLIQHPIPTSTPNTTPFEQEEFSFDEIVEMDVESETIVQSNHESDINPDDDDEPTTQVVLIDNSVPQPGIISGEHYVTISATPSSSSMAISQSQSSDVSSSHPLVEDIFSTALNRSGINFTDLNEEGNVANVQMFPFVTSEQGQIKTTYTTE